MVRVRTLVIRFTGDVRDLKKSVVQVGQETSNLGKLTAAGNVALKGLAIAGGLAATGIGYSVKAFADFDAALNESIAIMGDVSDEMRGEMAAAARQMALETTFSAEEAASAFYFLASAGMTAEQAIAALPITAQFAQAGMFDLERATELLVDSQTALGMRSEDAGQNLENMTRIADVLTEANNLAQGSVEQFAEALTNKAAGAAKAFNVPLEETVALLMAFAARGVKGETAGEKFAIMLRDVTRAAVREADNFAKFGVEVFDAEGNLKNLADVVGEFEDALQPMSDAEKAAALETMGMTRAVGDIIRTLLGSSDAIRGYEKALTGAAGTTEEVASKQLQTFNAQLTLLQHQLQDIAIEVGSKIVPKLLPLVDWLREHLPGAFDAMATIWREDVQPVLEDLAAVANDTAVPALKALWEWMDRNEGVAKTLAAALTGVVIALAGFAVIMKIVAVFKALSFVIPIIKGIGVALGFIGYLIGTVFFKIFNPINLAIGALVLLGRAAWGARDSIAAAFDAVLDAVLSVVGFVADHWQKMLAGLNLPLTLFVGFVVTQWAHIQAVVEAVIGAINLVVHAHWLALQGIWNLITLAAVLAWHAVRGAAVAAWQWIMDRTEGARQFIVDRLINLRDIVVGVWNAIKGAAVAAWQALYDFIAKIVGWIGDRVDDVFGWVGEVKDAWNSIPGHGIVEDVFGFVTGSTGGIAPDYLASGGLTRGMARGTDTVPAMLTPGEMVLNARQQSNLFRAVSSGNLGAGSSGGPPVYVDLRNSVLPDGAVIEDLVVRAIRRASDRGRRITLRGRPL